MSCPVICPEIESKIYNRDVNWSVFQDCLSVDLALAINFDELELDEKVKLLTDVLCRALTDSVKQGTGRARVARWWCRELDVSRIIKVAAERKWRRSRSRWGVADPRVTDARERFARARTRYVNKIRFYRRQSWLSCIKLSSETDPWGVAYKVIASKLKMTPVLNELLVDDVVITDPAQIVAEMLHGLLPDDDVRTDSAMHTEMRRYVAEPIEDWTIIRVSFDELRSAVFRQRNGRAPGVDGVRAEVVKKAYDGIELMLADIINEMWRTGKFPKSWKLGILKVFPKDKEKPRNLIRSYRPITLLPVLGKIAERVLADQLCHWLHVVNYFGGSQHGFMSGRSTVSAMMTVQRRVAESDNHYVLGVFLDISGAFDNAWWPLVFCRLRSRGCPNNILCLVHDYLRERTTTLRWDGVAVGKSLTKGCPQGSILGPILWNVMFEEFLEQDFGIGVAVVAYADDVVLLVPGNSRVEIEAAAGHAVEIAVRWSTRAKLQFSPTKSVTLMLKGDFHRWRRPVISMDGVRLACVSEQKYLGVTLGSGLHFKAHIELMLEKLKKTFFAFLVLAKANNGYGCKSLRMLYNGVAVPLFTYGCEMWGREILRWKTLRGRLLRLQRRLLIMVCKAYRTVSHEACYVLAGCPPIDLVIEERMRVHDDVSRGENREVCTVRHREETMVRWQTRWTESEKGRETFQYFPDVKSRLRIKNKNWNHYATQFLSGHGNFCAKLRGFALKQNPWCLHCGDPVEETAWHVLAECPLYEEERRELAAVWGESPRDQWRLLCVRPENFEIFARVTRLIGRKQEGREEPRND